MKYTTRCFAPILVLIILTTLVQAAYVKDAVDCGTAYQSQNCLLGDYVCGFNNNILYCEDDAVTNAAIPAIDATTETTLYNGALGGGYVLNCLKDDITCLPWVCQREAICYNIHRITQCNASTTGYACLGCNSGYTYCDSSYIDGNGCEVQIGVTPYPSEANAHYDAGCSPECNSGYYDCDTDLGTAGTGCEVHNGDSCLIGDMVGYYVGCTCTKDKEHFITATKANYSSDEPLLWGQQYGNGWLANLTNILGFGLQINNTGCIYFGYTDKWFCGDAGIGVDLTTYLNNSIGNYIDLLQYNDTYWYYDAGERIQINQINTSHKWINATWAENRTIISGDGINVWKNNTHIEINSSIWKQIGENITTKSTTPLNFTIPPQSNIIGGITHYVIYYSVSAADLISVLALRTINNETINYNSNNKDLMDYPRTLQIQILNPEQLPPGPAIYGNITFYGLDADDRYISEMVNWSVPTTGLIQFETEKAYLFINYTTMTTANYKAVSRYSIGLGNGFGLPNYPFNNEDLFKFKRGALVVLFPTVDGRYGVVTPKSFVAQDILYFFYRVHKDNG